MTLDRKCLIVGLTGLLLAAGLAVRVVATFDWDPTIFAAFGRDATVSTEYAEDQLSREVQVRNDLGHDGKYFFILANDPWLTEPDEHAVVLDRPKYRAQRILYPMLASLGGLLSPSAVVWSLVITNVLFMGVGTWVVAHLSSDMGGSPWWGLAFGLNVGFISEQNIDGAGVLAAAAAFGAVLLVRRGMQWPAIALLAAAALAREAMLLVAAGVALWMWLHNRRADALRALIAPTALVGLWALFVRVRLGDLPAVAEVQEIGLPLVGLVSAWDDWARDPVDLAAGFAVVAILLLYLRRALAGRKAIVAWAFVGFVPLAFLFTEQVWLNYFDITRAIAPVITAFLLLAFVGERARSPAEAGV